MLIKQTNIVRYFVNNKENDKIHTPTGLVGINERILFHLNENCINPHQENKNKWSIRLALVMVLLHELIGHSKLRIVDNNNETPSKYLLGGKWFTIKRGESVKMIESCISENENIINFFKDCKNEILAEKLLSDIVLWIDRDFSKFLSLVEFPQEEKLDKNLDFLEENT